MLLATQGKQHSTAPHLPSSREYTFKLMVSLNAAVGPILLSRYPHSTKSLHVQHSRCSLFIEATQLQPEEFLKEPGHLQSPLGGSKSVFARIGPRIITTVEVNSFHRPPTLPHGPLPHPGMRLPTEHANTLTEPKYKGS